MMESERAEQARAAIMRSLAAYRSGLGRLSGIGTSGRLTPAFEWRTDESNALAEIVALGEVFTDDRFQDAYRAPMDALTWSHRHTKWRQHGVDLVGWRRWQAMSGYIAARNAILHNNGHLTSAQTKSPERRQGTLTALRAANLQITTGDRLMISHLDVEAAALLIRDYIAWLDTTAPG